MYELRRSSFGGSLVEIVLLLAVIGAFLIVVTVIYVVRTFVKYHNHKSLWIALAGFIVSCMAAGLVYKLTAFDGSPVIAGIGVAVLLITCYACDLKNRDMLLRENVNLIDEVLHKPWWGSEDKPLQEQELEPVAA